MQILFPIYFVYSGIRLHGGGGGGGEQVGHTCNNLCHDRLTDQLLTSKISLFAYQNKQIETDY